MSLSLEWGAVAGVAPTHAVAIGFKYGTRGFDMQQKNNQAREQTEASLYAELVKLAPFSFIFRHSPHPIAGIVRFAHSPTFVRFALSPLSFGLHSPTSLPDPSALSPPWLFVS